MYSNFNYYPQTPQNRQIGSTGLKGRPVSSFEEAKALSIDFDGSIFYFPDMANKRIYTKQINMDGTANINVYELGQIPEEKPIISTSSLDNYVTKEELAEALARLSTPQPVKQEILPF